MWTHSGAGQPPELQGERGEEETCDEVRLTAVQLSRPNVVSACSIAS